MTSSRLRPRPERLLTAVLCVSVLAGCGGDDGDTPSADGGDEVAVDAAVAELDAGAEISACASATALERAPACGAAAAEVAVPSGGCAPTVDGVLHEEEWTGGACADVGEDGDVVHLRQTGGVIYLAFSATPACGCPMAFAFDPDVGEALDGDEFLLRLFDDPAAADGDLIEMVVEEGYWIAGAAPTGIRTRCPGDHPSPINYEIAIPLSALGIERGHGRTVGFAVHHPSASSWPPGLEVDKADLPVDPSTWGRLSSPSDWQ